MSKKAKSPSLRDVFTALSAKGHIGVYNDRDRDLAPDWYKERMRGLDDQNCESSDAVICMRVADATLVAPNSYQMKCVECGEAVWCGPNSPMTPPRVCLHCAESYIDRVKQESKE